MVDTIAASRHIGLICTRRVRRMSAYFCAPASLTTLRCWQEHFWLGTSTAHQQEFDAAWPHMRALAESGYTIFFSIAPMLGAGRVAAGFVGAGRPRWVIVAGEQGKHDRCRDMEADWARAHPRSMRERWRCFLLQAAEPQGADPIRPDDSRISARGATAVLINLRGTHGSGKSTAIRALMEKSNVRPIFGTTFGLRCPEGYKARLPEVEADVFVLGPYTTPCGGCDRIQPYDLIPSLIEKYAARGHVIFEGALISSCWGTIGRLLERWKRDAIIVFLDTPVDECIRRVRTRRLERGDEREFDPGL